MCRAQGLISFDKLRTFSILSSLELLNQLIIPVNPAAMRGQLSWLILSAKLGLNLETKVCLEFMKIFSKSKDSPKFAQNFLLIEL